MNSLKKTTTALFCLALICSLIVSCKKEMPDVSITNEATAISTSSDTSNLPEKEVDVLHADARMINSWFENPAITPPNTLGMRFNIVNNTDSGECLLRFQNTIPFGSTFGHSVPQRPDGNYPIANDSTEVFTVQMQNVGLITITIHNPGNDTLIMTRSASPSGQVTITPGTNLPIITDCVFTVPEGYQDQYTIIGALQVLGHPNPPRTSTQ